MWPFVYSTAAWVGCKNLLVAEKVYVWFPHFIPINKTISVCNSHPQKKTNKHLKRAEALEKLQGKRCDEEKFRIYGDDILWHGQCKSKKKITAFFILCVFIRLSLLWSPATFFFCSPTFIVPTKLLGCGSCVIVICFH